MKHGNRSRTVHVGGIWYVSDEGTKDWMGVLQDHQEKEDCWLFTSRFRYYADAGQPTMDPNNKNDLKNWYQAEFPKKWKAFIQVCRRERGITWTGGSTL